MCARSRAHGNTVADGFVHRRSFLSRGISLRVPRDCPRIIDGVVSHSSPLISIASLPCGKYIIIPRSRAFFATMIASSHRQGKSRAPRATLEPAIGHDSIPGYCRSDKSDQPADKHIVCKMLRQVDARIATGHKQYSARRLYGDVAQACWAILHRQKANGKRQHRKRRRMSRRKRPARMQGDPLDQRDAAHPASCDHVPGTGHVEYEL